MNIAQNFRTKKFSWKKIYSMKSMLITVQKKLAYYFYAFHKKVYGEFFFIIYFHVAKKTLAIQFHF